MIFYEGADIIAPTIAVSVPGFKVPGYIYKMAEKTGVLAAEITLSSSTVSDALKLAELLVRDGKGFKKCEVRFHSKSITALDFATPGDAGMIACERLSKMIKAITENYGPTYLTIHSPSSLSSSEVDEALERLHKLSKYASRQGAVLCLENLSFGWTSKPENLIRAAEKAKTSLVIDIGHINSSDDCRSGIFTRRTFIEAVGAYAVAAHIYEHEDTGHCSTDDCHLVWDALEALMFTPASWWVIELEKEEAFMQTFKLLESFLNHLNGIGQLSLKKQGKS